MLYYTIIYQLHQQYIYIRYVILHYLKSIDFKVISAGIY